MHVIVTGSLGYDFIMDFSGRFADRIMPDNLHKISLSFLADKLNKQFGGTAGNIAYSLNLLGTEPTIVSVAGNDFGPYKTFLESHRIDIAGITVFDTEPTSCYFVVTDKDDNQIGTFYTGAQKYASKLSLTSILNTRAHSEKSFVIISPQDPTAMKKFVAECREIHVPYLYDPAFQIGTFTKDELRQGIEGAELLIGNDYEIDLIIQTLEISHEELLVMGPKAVITTLGAKGSIIETRHDAIHVKPARAKNVSDPTGAGDAYRGGFIAGYVRALASDPRGRGALTPGVVTTDQLLVCGQMGAVAAVYTVEKYGTVTHHYTQEEFVKRYKENYGNTVDL